MEGELIKMEKLVIQNIGKDLGDFFFIELEKNGVKCVIMVDGHTAKNGYVEEAKKLLKKYDKIDYLIVTHVDGDHIKGILRFWKTKRYRSKFEDTVIIYNFVTQKTVNYKDAFKFEKMVDGNYVIPTGRYDYINFSNELLRVLSLEKRTKFDINDTYAYLTLIAPDKAGIQAVYEDYCNKLKAKSGDITKIEQPENDITNHNSIVFLLEFAGKKLLFMGDNDISTMEPLIDGLKNMSNAKIDVIKIGHHGAKDENERLVEFAKNHRCNQLIVTGETEWNEKHPDKDIMAELNASGISDIHLFTKVGIGNTMFPNIQLDSTQKIVILDEK